MTNEAYKIIQWALLDQNSYGGHIDALTYAINSGRIKGATLSQVEAKRAEWSGQ